MKIAVIGTGYVGLTTGACLAEIGHTVVCNDVDEKKIAMLEEGKCPIFEEQLPQLLQKHKGARLFFSTSLAKTIKDAEVIFICVGTPPKEDGSPDLSYVERVSKDIGKALDHYAIIVEKSTVPVRTAEWMRDVLKENISVEFDVAVNPEFLREGTSVHDFLSPERIVVGTESEKAKKVMNDVYEPLRAPIIHTTLNSAELIKHASNAFLAMKISYANLVSQLCDKTSADIEMVMDGVGMDRRIGKQFLRAGLGYGGFCFPKDLEAFISVFKKHGVDASLLEDVQKINGKQRRHVVELAKELLGDLSGKTVGVLGLAFKPNTDDVRFSPACFLIQDLQEKGAKVRATDPQAMENAKKVLSDVTFCDSAYEVVKGADLVILATEWDEFKTMNLAKIKESVSKFIDARNVFAPKFMRELGFEYRSVGRP